MIEKPKRINGITYLKAFLPLIVISCHINFGKSSFMAYPFPKFPDLKDIFNNNISPFAVPLFFLVSFYLYLLKRQRPEFPPKKLLKSRVLYFLKLFIVWRIIYIPFGIGRLWIRSAGLLKNAYNLFFDGVNSSLYYLEMSIYLLILLELFCTITEKLGLNKKIWSIVCFTLSVALIGVCNFALPAGSLKAEICQYFSPIGFLPYVFIPALIFEIKGNIKNSYLIYLAVLGIAFAVFEWVYLPDKLFLDFYGDAMVSYCKISTVLTSVALFGIFLKIKKTPSKFTEYLSRLSLYVYCVHPIIINLLEKFFKLSPYIKYIITVIVAYIVSILIYKSVNFLKNISYKNRRNKNG